MTLTYVGRTGWVSSALCGPCASLDSSWACVLYVSVNLRASIPTWPHPQSQLFLPMWASVLEEVPRCSVWGVHGGQMALTSVPFLQIPCAPPLLAWAKSLTCRGHAPIDQGVLQYLSIVLFSGLPDTPLLSFHLHAQTLTPCESWNSYCFVLMSCIWGFTGILWHLILLWILFCIASPFMWILG